MGKGRKERCVPLRDDVAAVLKEWIAERAARAEDPVFITIRESPMSRDAVERALRKHVNNASASCPSLRNKSVTPHTLRHTAAMVLLRSGVDRAVIALWLGHESVETTQMYLHADMKLKEQALARTSPERIAPVRYRPDDKLMAFLESL
jgi:site-specific recombinase XerD